VGESGSSFMDEKMIGWTGCCNSCKLQDDVIVMVEVIVIVIVVVTVFLHLF
jgi:hypothetical protein